MGVLLVWNKTNHPEGKKSVCLLVSSSQYFDQHYTQSFETSVLQEKMIPYIKVLWYINEVNMVEVSLL